MAPEPAIPRAPEPRPGPSADRLIDASATTFSSRAARWLIGIGVISLLATLVLSVLTTSDSPHEQTADNNAFSVSSVGHQALAEFYDAVGVDTVVSRHRSAERASPQRALLILEPNVTDSELEHLREMVAQAHKRKVPTLIALPKWRVSESVKKSGWANRIERATAYRIDELLRTLDLVLETDLAGTLEVFDGNTTTADFGEFAFSLKLDPTQCMASDDIEALVIADAEDWSCALLARVPGTTIHLLSDPEPLSTMGLGLADHAPIALALIEEGLGVKAVVIDEIAHGYEKAQTIWQELFRFPLVLVTFHLALFGALALWTATQRFGKPERPPPRVPAGKQTLIDNTATLLALGHHAGTGVKKYLEAALRQLARAYGLAPELSAERRLEHLAMLARRVDERHDLLAIARDVANLRDGKGRREERRARTLALRIYRLKSEMLHGDRSGS